MLQSGIECCHMQPSDGALLGDGLIAWTRSPLNRFEVAPHAYCYRKADQPIREPAKYGSRLTRDVFLDDPPRASGANRNA